MKKGLAQNNIYIDTSAIIPFYFKEIYSSKVEQLFELYDYFLISELSKIEFYSTARKKVRMGDATESEIKKVFRVFDAHLNQGIFSIINLEQRHFGAATKIIQATKNSLRSLDAVHLGIAYSENLSVFSFDKIFSESAKEFGITVINK